MSNEIQETTINQEGNLDITERTSWYSRKAAGVAMAVLGLVGASTVNSEPAVAAEGIHINTILEGAETSDLTFDSLGNPVVAAIDADTEKLSLVACNDNFCGTKEAPFLVDTSVNGVPSIEKTGPDSYLIAYTTKGQVDGQGPVVDGAAIKLAECTDADGSMSCSTKTLDVNGTELQPRDLTNVVVDMDIAPDNTPVFAIATGLERGSIYYGRCLPDNGIVCNGGMAGKVEIRELTDLRSQTANNAKPQVEVVGAENSVLSYYDASETQVIAKQCETIEFGLSCSDNPNPTTLDEEGDVGQGLSATLRNGDIPMAAYHYVPEEENAETGEISGLRIGTCAVDTECADNGATSWTIDDTVGEDIETSLAVKEDGNPIVAYRAGIDLRFAAGTQSDFSGENYLASNMDGSANPVVGEVNMEISDQNKTAITYQEQVDGQSNLKIVVCVETDCGFVTDPAPDNGASSSSSNVRTKQAAISLNSSTDPTIPNIKMPVILGRRLATDPRYVLGPDSPLNSN